jgi:hypothetical protein
VLLISGEKILNAAASAVKAGEEAVVAAEEKTQEVFNEYVRSIHSKMIAVKFIDNFFSLQVAPVAADTINVVKEKVADAAKVTSEYAEVLTEKVANAAETGNEYLAQGAEIVKEYAT